MWIHAPLQYSQAFHKGPYLVLSFFLVFINHIVQRIPVKIRLFPDDCIIYQEVTSPNDQVLQNAFLGRIHTGCSKWQMTITCKKNPITFPYCFDIQPLAVVTNYEYLGIIISHDLRWNHPTDYIQRKAMKKFGYLWRCLASLHKRSNFWHIKPLFSLY